MSTKSLQNQNLFNKSLKQIFKEFFLSTLWTGNIFININDIIYQKEVQVS